MDKGVMGREDCRESKKLPVFRPHASGISQALWPAETRRSLSTSRAAQKRRHLVLRSKGWSIIAMLLTPLVQAMQAAPSLFMGTVTLLVGGGILAGLFFHFWALLLFPALILSILSLAITPVFFLKLKHLQYPGLTYGFQSKTTRVPHSIVPSGYPTMRRSPETPMPSMPTVPLVRELETFDLSQTGVEHFLDGSTERSNA